MVHRSFTAEFKRQIVEEVSRRERSMAEICREHQLSRALVDQWREQYRTRGPEAWTRPASPEGRLKEAERRVEELERALGRATLEIEFLKRSFRRAGLPFPRDASP